MLRLRGKYSGSVVVVFLVGLVLCPPSFGANESSYRYCLFTGYFGVNSFLGSLAQKLASRDGVMGDTVCQATWKQGYEVGERMRRGSKVSAGDMKVVREAIAFSDHVYSFIIRGANL
jgi:hypothetical protein